MSGEPLVVLASAQHQRRCAEALAAGLARRGWKASVQTPKPRPSLPLHVACWGWHLGRQLRDRGHQVLVMERAYLGNRFEWYSLAWNGLNGRGTFPALRDDPCRFQKHFGDLLQPWRRDEGAYALVVGQVPGDASLQGRDMGEWYNSIAVQCADAYGKPVWFREHPEAQRRGINRTVPRTVGTLGGPLSAALDSAHICVTFNSNTAVESVLRGIPTVACDRGSMAHEVCGHGPAQRITPDRALWAARLAWKQWRLEEIAAGDPFDETS